MTEAAVEEQDQEKKPRRRRKGQMLPPTGEGPLEVTPDTFGEEKPQPAAPAVPHPAAPEPASAVTQETTTETDADAEVKLSPSGVDPCVLLPAPIAASLEAVLPEPDAEPAAVISAIEQRLHAAGLLQEAMQKRTLSAYFYYAGPAVRLADDTGHWQHMIDPATGKPMRSWSAWLRSVKVSRQHAYRMTKEEPLMEALARQGVTQLNTRQIDALSPALTQYGAAAVREIWKAAVELEDTSGPTLLKLRSQLNYEPKQVAGQDESEERTSATSPPVLRFQTRAGAFDAQQVRQAARAQPEIARMVALEILSELGEEAPGVVSRDTTPTG